MFIVCGKEAWDADKLGQLCRDYPSDEVYALPWIESKKELSDNLKGNGGRPNRLWPCDLNCELMDGEFQEFDESLGSDALGRMAHLISQGHRIRNEIMCSPCGSPFYGKIVSKYGGGSLIFLLSISGVSKLFPMEPLSAKLYAATTVPVRFKTSDLFAKVSKIKSPYVDILIANDYLPGSAVFLKFYKLASGVDFVGLDDPIERDQILPVFRYNRGYKYA